MMRVLQNGLPEELHIKGEKTVSCFAEFRPLDESNHLGPWKSVTGFWGNGNIESSDIKVADNIEDQGEGSSKKT
jgi:hypothetical protein